MNLLDNYMAKHKTLPLTVSIQNAEFLTEDQDSMRVTASFNRKPLNAKELASTLEATFGNKMSVVKDSMIEESNVSGRLVVSGFMAKHRPVVSVKDVVLANYRETASNIFIDKRDKSVWMKVGNNLVRQDEDDLCEVASLAKAPILETGAGNYVYVNPEFAGIENTEALAFFEPTMNQILVGVRVGTDQVLTPNDGLFEVAQACISQRVTLHGQDNAYASQETASIVDDQNPEGYDVSKTVNYYEKLFGTSGDFWSSLEQMIKDKAMA